VQVVYRFILQDLKRRMKTVMLIAMAINLIVKGEL